MKIGQFHVEKPFSDDPADKRIKCYVYLRYTSNGKRITRPTQQYLIKPETSSIARTHNSKTKKAIADSVDKLKKELESNTPSNYLNPDVQRRTDFLSEFDWYLEQRKQKGKTKPQTLAGYKQCRDHFSKFVGGMITDGCTIPTDILPYQQFQGIFPIARLDEQSIIDFQKFLLSNLRKNTAHRHMNVLGICLKFLFKNKRINTNPMDLLEKGDRIQSDYERKSNPELREKSFFTQQECLQIYNNRYNRRKTELFDTTLAWLFCTVTGLRHSDITTLSPSNIKTLQFNGSTIHYLEVWQTKTGHMVEIPLNHTALALLDEVKTRNPLFEHVCFRIKNNNDYHTLLTGTNIQKTIRYHNSRHSFNEMLRVAGVKREIRESLLGHSGKKSTEELHYQSDFVMNPADHLDAVNRIDWMK